MEDYLASVYYDPKRSGGFGGVDRLYKDVKKEGKFNISRTKIKEWLIKQDHLKFSKEIFTIGKTNSAKSSRVQTQRLRMRRNQRNVLR